MGVVIGRVANRISDAQFKNVDGQEIHLTPNDNGKHALHGECRMRVLLLNGIMVSVPFLFVFPPCYWLCVYASISIREILNTQ